MLIICLQIGHVNGDKASQFAGSMVDQEGDVLDEEGNIIGHADSVEESLKDVDPKPIEEGTEGSQNPLEEATEGSQKPTEGAEGIEKPEVEGSKADLEKGAEDIEKPDVKGPFGVQDKGEITNASGLVIGKLVEGEPQDLVGQSIAEIDEEGNLKNKTGSVIGKGELNPTLEKGSQDASELPEGSKAEVPEGELPKDAEGSKVEVPEGAEGEKPEVPEGEVAEGEKPEGELPEGEVPEAEAPDLSILKDKTVNKLGKIVDAEGNPFGTLVEGEAKKLAG